MLIHIVCLIVTPDAHSAQTTSVFWPNSKSPGASSNTISLSTGFSTHAAIGGLGGISGSNSGPGKTYTQTLWGRSPTFLNSASATTVTGILLTSEGMQCVELLGGSVISVTIPARLFVLLSLMASSSYQVKDF